MKQNRRTAPAKSGSDKAPAEQVLRDIRRQTRRQYSAEDKIRIAPDGHVFVVDSRGEPHIAGTGPIFARRLHERGLTGIVLDGGSSAQRRDGILKVRRDDDACSLSRQFSCLAGTHRRHRSRHYGDDGEAHGSHVRSPA